MSDNDVQTCHSAIQIGGTNVSACRNRIRGIGRYNYADCIQIGDCDGCRVEDNTIEDVDTTGATVSQIVVWPGIGYPGLQSRNVSVRRNRFARCKVTTSDDRCGLIAVRPGRDDTTIDGVEVEGNTTADCHGAGVVLSGPISGSVRVEANRMRRGTGSQAVGVRVHSSVPAAAQIGLDWNQYSGIDTPETDER